MDKDELLNRLIKMKCAERGCYNYRERNSICCETHTPQVSTRMSKEEIKLIQEWEEGQ